MVRMTDPRMGIVQGVVSKLLIIYFEILSE